MKEIFLKYKIVIFRSLGAIMLVVGFSSYFWTMPKKVLTQNQIAAANVARMEASVVRSQGVRAKPKSSSAEILKHLKNSQEAQNRYLTIFMMIFGVGFLGYSFMSKSWAYGTFFKMFTVAQNIDLGIKPWAYSTLSRFRVKLGMTVVRCHFDLNDGWVLSFWLNDDCILSLWCIISSFWTWFRI